MWCVKKVWVRRKAQALSTRASSIRDEADATRDRTNETVHRMEGTSDMVVHAAAAIRHLLEDMQKVNEGSLATLDVAGELASVSSALTAESDTLRRSVATFTVGAGGT